MRPLFASTTVVWLAVGFAGIAKPPDLPTIPETDFKVLSPLAQDFYQPEQATTNDLFLVDASWAPAAGWSRNALNAFRADCGSFTGRGSNAAIERKADAAAELRLAREVFTMAEWFRQDGDWTEAMRWYNGVMQIFPRSTYAQMAGERIERSGLLRVNVEGGEEQIENPSTSDAPKPEQLTVLPRLVLPSRLLSRPRGINIIISNGTNFNLAFPERLTVIPRELDR